MSAPFVGRAADRVGKRHVMVAASFLMAATILLSAMSQSLGQIIFWRFAQGVVTPGVFAVAVAYIHDRWEGAPAAMTTAAYVTGTVIGGFFGRVVAGLTASLWGWRGSFVTIGVMSLGCALVLALTLPRDTPFDGSATHGSGFGSRGSGIGILRSGLAKRLTTRPLLGTYAAGFCVLFTQIAMFTYVTFHLAAAPFALSTAALGWLFSVYLAGAVLTPISGRWINRYGYRAALAIAMAIGIAGSLLTLGHFLAEVVAGLALVASGVFIAQAAANGYIGIAARSDRGLAVGMYATCYYIGGSVGGAVPALFWNTGGWTACVTLVIAVQLLTAAFGSIFWTS
jgi:predicted MFS family arabinose efflux permease